jgi:hypothetical protein
MRVTAAGRVARCAHPACSSHRQAAPAGVARVFTIDTQVCCKQPVNQARCKVETNPLLGTWKLKAYLVTTAAGAAPAPFGVNPTGYLRYCDDGRMQVIGAAKDRTPPGGAAPTDAERAALYDSMFAYAGSYSVQGNKVIHHVDVSWNESWTGTEQIRLFEVSGNTLTLSTRIADPSTGVESSYALIWEKLVPPADQGC